MAMLAAFWLRPGTWEAACAVDARGLRERVTTALEFSGVQSLLVNCQRQDALSKLKGFDAKGQYPLRWPRWTSRILACSLVLVLVLAVLPNPMQPEVERRVAVKKEIDRQEKKIEQVKKKLQDKNEVVQSPTRQETINTLEELQKSLGKAGEEKKALQALAGAEEKLNRELQDTEPGFKDDISRLAGVFREHKQTRELADKMASGDAAGTRQEVEKLAKSLGSMGEKERQALATGLQNAAGDISNSGLGKALQEAGCALNGP